MTLYGGSNVEFRQRQFALFDRAREEANFTRQVPTQVDIRTRVTFDPATAQAGENKIQFFTDINQSDRAIKTQDPFIDRAGNIEREVLIGAYGMSLIPDAANALDVVELNEAVAKLGAGDFELKAGQDFITQLYTGKMLARPAGYEANDVAAGETRRQVEALCEWLLPRLVILNPGVKLQATQFYSDTWTGSTPFSIDFILHSFVARQ